MRIHSTNPLTILIAIFMMMIFVFPVEAKPKKQNDNSQKYEEDYQNNDDDNDEYGHYKPHHDWKHRKHERTIYYVYPEGKVGIQTYTPNSELDVKGTVEIGQKDQRGLMLSSASENEFTLKTWNLIQPRFSLSVGDGLGGISKNWLRGEGEFLSLNPEGGNVGIGTSTPGARLEVFAGNEGYLSLNFAQGGKAGLLFQEAQNNRGGMIYNTQSLDLYTGNQITSPQVSILDNGNVGIGIPSPQTKLEVSGTTTTTDLVTTGTLGVGTANPRSTLEVVGTTTTTGLDVDQKITAENLVVRGNVGIGTSNPQTKLAVDGTVTAKEIVVSLNGWSDFVFDPDFKLQSLEEVEKHIQQNRHLPDIPSEKEVVSQGVPLGEMQAKLLQKIEELTLYMIDQNKKQTVQNQKIQVLVQENGSLKQRLMVLEQKQETSSPVER